MTLKIIEEKLNEQGLKFERDVSMEKHTSFRTGGKAAIFLSPDGEEELLKVLSLLQGDDVPRMVLGNGSNVLVRDGGYPGVIIHLGKGFDFIRREGEALICGSGSMLSAAAREAQRCGLGGIEFASGIPGSIGGAVFMNAGAYGGEIADVLRSVRLASADGSSIREAAAEELKLGYRRSKIQETGEVVTEARFRLRKDDPENIQAMISDYTLRRNAKQPVQLPSAGSFFKRPEGHYAGKLIEDAGLKGLRVGDAQVSELHAGFIVNRGKASASEILKLMEIVQARVLEEFGVLLEPEVRIIGEE